MDHSAEVAHSKRRVGWRRHAIYFTLYPFHVSFLKKLGCLGIAMENGYGWLGLVRLIGGWLARQAFAYTCFISSVFIIHGRLVFGFYLV